MSIARLHASLFVVQRGLACRPGLYATETGCYRNGIPLSSDLKTLAHHFRESGYTTGYIGKWHLYDRGVEGPVPESARGGYEYWLASNVLEFTSDAYLTPCSTTVTTNLSDSPATVWMPSLIP